MDIIKESDNILVLWNKISSQDSLQTLVESLNNKLGSNGKIQIENIERLSMANYNKSTFDVIISGIVDGDNIEHTSTLLNQYANILKRNGKTLLYQKIGVEPYIESDQFISAVKTCGLLIDEHTTNNNLITLYGRKPNFEIGSSVKLSFTCKPDTAAVWKISDTVDEDIETVDPDTLLDEDDLKKPDAASLRVCGTTGLRKACKDCSCGLAEELDTESRGEKTTTEAAKSSCGNCYLGDAFRCASCPYIGMPAFKPGEKILLSDSQLKADI